LATSKPFTSLIGNPTPRLEVTAYFALLAGLVVAMLVWYTV